MSVELTPRAGLPDASGRFGRFGGRFVPEALRPALLELEAAYRAARVDPAFQAELAGALAEFSGRPTPLDHAARWSERVGATVLLKREDLNHTGAHKLNNTLGQILLARRMGKRRVIAETGAGQHGVATAAVAARYGLACDVFMGEEDMRRQRLNVKRMELMGARVRPVTSGTRTLKDACNEAIRDWIATAADTHYLIGSVVGPHPYPWLVRDFQAVIGTEARRQCRERLGRSPDLLVACVGGGSNAIGLFHPFLDDAGVAMVGVEAAGEGLASGRHAATLTAGSPGVLHGCLTYLLQDDDGQIRPAHSISAGLDYPGVGPEHAWCRDTGRVRYEAVTDEEALDAFALLSRLEGIVPALESAHAVAYLDRRRGRFAPDTAIVLCLSGRGDKDLDEFLLRRGGGRDVSADLHTRLRAARAAGRPILAPYLCAGFPRADLTLRLLRSLADAGADCLEIGVPFSDPLADGGSLQRASQAALAAGMTLARALALADRFARERDVPVILMSYLNPLLRAGGAAALRDAAASGCAAVIVPDLPPEEASLLAGDDGRLALPLVPLVAPNTPDARLRELGALDPPFLYCVSVLGVTGARAGVDALTLDFLRRVRTAAPHLPALVGFGVATPEQAAALGAVADGVIVGSALVDHLMGQPDAADHAAAAAAFLRPLRAALDALPARAKGAASC